MRLLVSIINLLIGISICAKDIEIRLYDVDRPILGTRYIARPVWHGINGKRVTYTIKDGLFSIEAEAKDGQIKYCILNKTDTVKQISFPQDSVSVWAINQEYDSHAVKFKFNKQEFFFIPGTKLAYNDTIYNEFPCMISDGAIKHGTFGNNGPGIFLLRDDSVSAPTVYIKENGTFHTNKSLNGLNYKSGYDYADTIPLNSKPFRIKAIDWNNSRLLLSPIYDKPSFKKIGSELLKDLSGYFNHKEYIFIDFWGTWCNPCIQSIPKLKELHASYKEHVAFLSICYDDPKNYGSFKNILDKYKIEWPNRFIQFNTANSIVEHLNIETFPSFLLINKEGDIIFLFSGENDFPKMTSSLKALFH